MSKKLYTYPVYKTVYGMVYIIADDEKQAYQKWQNDEIADESFDFDENKDCDIDSGCDWREIEEWTEALPNGVIPHGGDYREILVDQYNRLSDELNRISKVLNSMNEEKESN